MNTPSRLHIPIDEIFISDEAAGALQDAGIDADDIAARFSHGAWDHYGPGEAETRRAIQYRREIQAAFVLPAPADAILITTWQDGFLTLELEGEDDEE